MSGQRGDTDCLARSGLFIDDDNWFGNTRTSPIRLRTTTCAFRAHQRSSMSAEQQSHKTRGACSVVGTLSQLGADLYGGP